MTIYAAIRYQDPDKAITWLCSAFGFVEHSVSRDPDGGFQHRELRLGDSVVMVSGPGEPGWMGSKPMDPLTSSITLYAAGAAIVQEPMRMDYGSTEYSARDPEGNLWSFGT